MPSSHTAAARVTASRCVALIVALLSLTAAKPTEARWLRAESPLFVVYSDGSEPQLRDFTQSLQQFDALLRKMTGLNDAPAGGKLDVYLVHEDGQLRQINPYLSHNVVGFYFASPSGMFIAAPSSGDGDWAPAQATIFHEYTHHFSRQHFKAACPAWCDEGLAEYFAPTKFRKAKATIGGYQESRAFGIADMPWISIDKLFAGPNDPKHVPVTTEEFYPESWIVIHYLVDSGRQPQLGAYIAALQNGQQNEAAFRSAFNMDFAAFDQLVRTYRARGELSLREVDLSHEFKPAAITVTTLPPSADRLLLLHARLRNQIVHTEDQAAVLTKVEADAAEFRDDPLALHTLGLAEALYGDPAKADVALDRVLTLNGDDVEALFLKEERYYVAGLHNLGERDNLWHKARVFAGEVQKRDPNYYPALYLYANIRMTESLPTQNTLNVMLLAHNLAPQVDQITLSSAQALIAIGQPELGRALAMQLVNAPHGSPVAEAAQKLVDRNGSGAEKEAPQ